MGKAINTTDDLTITMELERLLFSRPVVKYNGERFLGDTFAGMLASVLYQQIRAKHPEMVVGQRFTQTFVEISGTVQVRFVREKRSGAEIVDALAQQVSDVGISRPKIQPGKVSQEVLFIYPKENP